MTTKSTHYSQCVSLFSISHPRDNDFVRASLRRVYLLTFVNCLGRLNDCLICYVSNSRGALNPCIGLIKHCQMTLKKRPRNDLSISIGLFKARAADGASNASIANIAMDGF